MIKRQGRIWDLGAPYLAGSQNNGLDQSVAYSFPECANSTGRKKWENDFRNKKDFLGDHLVEKLRKYMGDYHIHRECESIPYTQIGDDCAVLHMGDNGRWFEVGPTSFGGCLVFHNIDGYKTAIAGFNIGSDALEFIDESILCPRINIEGEKYKISYPLPNGKDLPLERVSALTNPEIFNRWFEVAKLDNPEITDPFGYKFRDGKIYVENEAVHGEVDNGWKVWGTTFIMAKLLDSFVYG